MTGSVVSTRVGVGTAFGTFGELLQGVLAEPCPDFLVTLPIALWTVATFRLQPESPVVRVKPATKLKSLRLAKEVLAAHGVATGGTLLIESDLPEGKGLASSSADLVATARAVTEAIGVSALSRAIESWVCEIEPTDGVMYPGVVAFYHRAVRLRTWLGFLPPLTIVAVDEGGVVDTIDFNRIPKPFTDADKGVYARLLDTLANAIRTGDTATVGRVATRSAILNQKLSPKQKLADMIDTCERIGGLGVAVAHSGTALGILLANDDPRYHTKLRRARRACAALAGETWVLHTLNFRHQGAAVRLPDPSVPSHED